MPIQLDHNKTSFIKKQFPITLICDRVNSPANMGSLFRIADSFGVEQIYFCGEEITVMSKRMERTARSTHKIIPYHEEDDIIFVIDALKEKGYTILALEITENSVAIDTYQPNVGDKIALVIGEENLGVSDQVLEKAANALHINMFGNNSSMNVATATAIALYELTKSL